MPTSGTPGDGGPVALPADAGRPIVRLTTAEVVGWTFDRPPVTSPTWLDDLVERATGARRLGGGADPGWLVVPWAVCDHLLQGEPDELSPAIAAGLVVELPLRRHGGEFEIAAHLLAATGVPACHTFDGSIDTLVSMHRRLRLDLVRFRRPRLVSGGASELEARLDREIVRTLHDTGVPVVVDGVLDDVAAAELEEAGVELAQGPFVDRRVAAGPTR